MFENHLEQILIGNNECDVTFFIQSAGNKKELVMKVSGFT